VYQRLFPDRDFPITWYAYVDSNKRSPFLDFMKDLPAVRQAKVIARMQAFAENNWRSFASYAKQIEAPIHHTVYEIKSHQDRILFIRCQNDAVAINGFTKKDDWSKKDASTLKASMPLVDEAVRECKERKPS
jgi:phage-related protein